MPDEAEADAVGNIVVDPMRRDAIIVAADDLLREDGLDGLTIRAVLNRTGLARRAFYQIFGGKDDLVLAVFERVLQRAAREFGRQLTEVESPLDRIRVIVVGIVLGASVIEPTMIDRRSVALSREHLRLAEARPAELAQALRPLLALIAAQVEDGMREAALRQGDPVLAARLIYNLVATTTHTELLRPGNADNGAEREALAGAIWEFCHHAIAA